MEKSEARNEIDLNCQCSSFLRVLIPYEYRPAVARYVDDTFDTVKRQYVGWYTYICTNKYKTGVPETDTVSNRNSSTAWPKLGFHLHFLITVSRGSSARADPTAINLKVRLQVVFAPGTIPYTELVSNMKDSLYQVFHCFVFKVRN